MNVQDSINGFQAKNVLSLQVSMGQTVRTILMTVLVISVPTAASAWMESIPTTASVPQSGLVSVVFFLFGWSVF